jgi:phosphoribosylformylglycinamidine synthase
VILSEEEEFDVTPYLNGSYEQENIRHPVELELELVLGKMPQKVREEILKREYFNLNITLQVFKNY